MTVIMLTPQQAATQASVSRGTIMNAIKDGSLAAFRDNRNRWQISDKELSKWMTERTVIAVVNPKQIATSEEAVTDTNLIRMAVLEAELRSKDQRIVDLEGERDSWKKQAQELARRVPLAEPVAPPRRRRWWPF